MKAKRVLAWTAVLLLGTVILAAVAGLTFRVAQGPVLWQRGNPVVMHVLDGAKAGAGSTA